MELVKYGVLRHRDVREKVLNDPYCHIVDVVVGLDDGVIVLTGEISDIFYLLVMGLQATSHLIPAHGTTSSRSLLYIAGAMTR